MRKPATSHGDLDAQPGEPPSSTAAPVTIVAMSEPELLITTTETVAGHRVVRTLGLVSGTEAAWGDVPRELADNAHLRGADAVLTARWYRLSHGPDIMYGTAVVIEPEAG